MLKNLLVTAFFDTLDKIEYDSFLHDCVEKSKKETIIYKENEIINTAGFPVYEGIVSVIDKKNYRSS